MQHLFPTSSATLTTGFFRFAIRYASSSQSLTMYCQSAFHPRSHKNQHDANLLCFGTSVAKIATNSKGNKETSLNEISKKTGIHFNVCFYSVSLLENDMLVVLKGPWQKPLRYGIHNHFCYKMSSFMFLFMYPVKCLGLWTYTLRSVHVDLDM